MSGAAASLGFSRTACGGREREPAGCVPGFLVLKPEGRCSHAAAGWRWERGGSMEDRVESVHPVGGRNLCTVSAEVPCGVLAPSLQSRTVSQDTGTGWRPPRKGRARLTEIGMSKLLEVRVVPLVLTL